MLKKLINGRSIYAWRFLVMMLLVLFGFFGTRLYAQIDRNTQSIVALSAASLQSHDIDPLRKDIRELRSELRDVNGYLRDLKK